MISCKSNLKDTRRQRPDDTQCLTHLLCRHSLLLFFKVIFQYDSPSKNAATAVTTTTTNNNSSSRTTSATGTASNKNRGAGTLTFSAQLSPSSFGGLETRVGTGGDSATSVLVDASAGLGPSGADSQSTGLGLGSIISSGGARRYRYNRVGDLGEAGPLVACTAVLLTWSFVL